MSEIILIVEDEVDLAATVEFNLVREGYSTRIAHDGRTAVELAAAEPPPDLVLLDLMLPDISGKELCRRFRADPRLSDMAIVMVTARADEIDRVVGFEVGADDYVTKPFSVRELVLRVRAILRRARPQAERADGEEGRIEFGCLVVDPGAYRVTVEGDEIVLTALEFKLLQVMLSRRGRVQTRDQLLRDVWDITADVNTRTVDTHIKRLRQKIGAAADYIETLRGVGYRFRESA